jgi:ornithine cyclodeaminase/alanine dehydrogenase-like protein (mu-crystallin family)
MGNHPAVGEDVTFFKSVGVSSQDVAAGYRALANAAELDIGLAIR